MKTTITFLIAGLVVISVAPRPLMPSRARADETLPEQRLYQIGVQAYIYAYPMLLMEITRRVATNVPAPAGAGAPMNQFAHLRAFPNHEFRDVVRPNADTLYSIAWLDVAREPIVLSVPDTSGRYYLLQMLDMWSEVFASPGSRTSGTAAGNFAIVGPGWSGDLPEGVEPIRAPTNIVWIIGRTQTNGKADYENVHRIQDGYQLTPLNQWGKSYSPPAKSLVDASVDKKTPPPAQIDEMNAKTFFETFARLMKTNPPHEVDWPMVAQLKQIGIVPGSDFDFSKLDVSTQAVLQQAVGDARKMIAEKAKRPAELVNGWQINRDFMGSYGASYLQRAYVAQIALGANVAEEAVYPMTGVDGKGQPLGGNKRYVIHFRKPQIPPVRAFWSITMYDADGYMVKNPIERYAIGDRDKLKLNQDGSLDLYLQRTSPGADKQSNWLPAPAGAFNLTMRLYWPQTAILTGTWNPPPVRQTQ